MSLKETMLFAGQVFASGLLGLLLALFLYAGLFALAFLLGIVK